MTIGVQETKSTLTQPRWPAGAINAGSATVALARGVDRLAWAKAKKTEDTAMTNSERWEEAAPAVDDSDVRMDKIERLRAAIADGTYSVSAEVLADRMIDHMREVDATGRELRRDEDSTKLRR